jgi:putative nucleotidyltransferase with HDIG domain
MLDGLRRTLRSVRDQWDVEFANGGETALAKLAEKPFDAIVSDMRMPGMDGATLLRLVMDQHPELLRIILSGQSEAEEVARTVGVAHQYLSKPCALEELKETIERAFSLRDVLTNPQLRAILSKIGSIPSIPAVYQELVELLESPFATNAQVGAVISRDMGMCAKVLQLANSAFFGRRLHISDPGEAAAFLGFNTFKALVLAVQLFRAGENIRVKGFSIGALWQHSLQVSVLAKQIAQTLAPGNKQLHSQAQTAGLLHDVGRLVIAANLADQYQEIMAATHAGRLYVDVEREIFGVSHAELGAYVLALWGLPKPVVEAIAFHHADSEIVSRMQNQEIIVAIHTADALIRHYDLRRDTAKGSESDDFLHYLDVAKMSSHFEEWRCLTAKLFGEVCPEDALV